jgi:hypothetical protein
LLSLPAVQFSPGCRPAAAAEKFPACGELFQYGQYRGTKGWGSLSAGSLLLGSGMGLMGATQM